MNVVIIGCGDIGTRCARLLLDAGHQVLGVKRNPLNLPDWLPGRQADVLDPASLQILHPQAALPIDVVIYILAASSFNEQAYQDAYVTGVQNTIQALAGGL